MPLIGVPTLRKTFKNKPIKTPVNSITGDREFYHSNGRLKKPFPNLDCFISPYTSAEEHTSGRQEGGMLKKAQSSLSHSSELMLNNIVLSQVIIIITVHPHYL